MAAPRPAEYMYVPTADLSTIQFINLFEKEKSELIKLITACEKDGFFYLDLQHGGSEKFWTDLYEIDTITKKWFKAIGNQSGAVQSLKDGFEALKIGKFESDGRWALPSVAQNNPDLFDQFTAACHFFSKLLLDCISDEMGLKGDARLESHHQDDCRSKSTPCFLHFPPSWGLQVFSPEDATLKYVVPRPGHAIVNVGDTLRFLSNKRLRSALHRVLPQGHVQTEDRYSISYFLRASDSTEFEDSNGENSSAKQWYMKKYELYELPHTIQKEHTTLSGGMAQELQATF
ncbi:hypothetical protein AtubIFM56815_002079 [Aspergillus tubingensis]|uniref:Fe2OG dioxygenase domain-containing protein n=1 Tax=Aspergillus tubingensis TaxID=5068 RepID=A0A9W6AT79_ASPTU|nr:hypothetical protein AtubIFM56815_002079 [Aspergillus tubingensis]